MFKAINLKKLITSVIIPLLVGFLSVLFTSGNMDIYNRINTPPLSPPSFIFPIAWTILYILMGISLYLVRTAKGNSVGKRKGYLFYALQLGFNFFWSIFFFGFNLFSLSAVWLGLMIILIGLNIFYFMNENKLAGKLLIPYILWCLFALYLNIGIVVLN